MISWWRVKGVGNPVMKEEDGKTLHVHLPWPCTYNVRTFADLGMKKHPGIPLGLREQAQERSQHWVGGKDAAPGCL